MDHPHTAFKCLSALLLASALTMVVHGNASSAWVMEYRGGVSPNHHGIALQRPSAIAFDPASKELCVTDTSARELRVFSAAGIYVFATGSLSALSQPASAVMDAHGGFFLTDSEVGIGRRVRKLNYRGEPTTYPIESPRAGWSPDQMILTGDGHLLVLDSAAALLSKHHASSGALLWQRDLKPVLGEPGARESWVFGRPALAPDGRIYLPCSSLHLVYVFSADGELITSFGEFRATRGGMVFPQGVAFGPEGTVLVLDRLRHLVLLYEEREGGHHFKAEFGAFGDGPGQFYHPAAIAATPDGRVFVAQGYQGRVQRFQLINTDAGRADQALAPDVGIGTHPSFATRTASADEARGWWR